MKFLLLIHQGPAMEAFETMSAEEKKQVGAEYQAVNETPGFTPGVRMQPPEKATTVRVKGDKPLTTDGPYAETKDAVGGYCFFEADDLDGAIALAARIPAARLGGGIEIRELVESGW